MHGPSNVTSPFWNRVLAPYKQADNGKAAFQLVTTSLLFAGAWYLMYRSLAISYGLTLLLAVPTAGLLTRMFIFQHDCGHGSFFSSRRANDLVGAAIGVVMLTPYAYWKRTHAIHHATSGDLDRRSFGDIETLTVKEYWALSRIQRIWYRLYRNPFLLLSVGPVYQFFIKHRLPLDIPRSWTREWRSVMGTNLVIAAAWIALASVVGWKAFFMIQLPITLIATTFGMWLFYIQHQFEDTYWREHPEWDFHAAGLEGSSLYDLPQIMHWFTGNIGFHHIHHLASKIPNYKLQASFREVKELQHVTRLKFWQSLRCAFLALWDEKEQQLVSFRTALQRRRALT